MALNVERLRKLSKRDLRMLSANVERYALDPQSRYYPAALVLREILEQVLRERDAAPRVVTCFAARA